MNRALSPLIRGFGGLDKQNFTNSSVEARHRNAAATYVVLRLPVNVDAVAALLSSSTFCTEVSQPSGLVESASATKTEKLLTLELRACR